MNRVIAIIIFISFIRDYYPIQLLVFNKITLLLTVSTICNSQGHVNLQGHIFTD